MTTRYANKTKVPVSQSINAVRSLLQKHGADAVAIIETNKGAACQFVFEDKQYKMVVHYPSEDNDIVKYSPQGKLRTESQIASEIESEKRRVWRSLLLFLKAAIEAHYSQVVDLKRSLLSSMVLKSGKTFYQEVEPRLAQLDVDPTFMLEM